MAYTYQEFPKALYRQGDYMAVKNAEEESVMAADGWADWNSDQARMNDKPGAPVEPAPAEDVQEPMPVKRGPGRPPKAR